MSFWRVRIAIDLGTTYSFVSVGDATDIRKIPTCLAIDRATSKPLAIGEEAKLMKGKTPDSVEIVEPLRDGVISDFETATTYLEFLVQWAKRRMPAFQYDILLCMPWGATAVELKSYQRQLQSARQNVWIVREPFAAAVGAGEDLFSPDGCTTMDIGGGTVEIATIAQGFMVHCETVRLAGNVMDQMIMDRLRKDFQFEVGRNTAEEIKIRYGSVASLGLESDREPEVFEVRGTNRRTRLPGKLILTTEHLRSFLEPAIESIEQALLKHRAHLPPEFVDSYERKGLTMVGGGAGLAGWRERLEHKLNIPVRIHPDAQYAVIRGMASMLERSAEFRGVWKISETVAA